MPIRTIVLAVPTRTIVLAVMIALSVTIPARADTTPGIMSTLFEPFETLSNWVSNLFSHEEHFVANEIERFKHTVDSDLSSFDTLVKQAGFQISSVSIGAGLDPDISLSMDFVRRLSEPEKAALMAKITDTVGIVGTIERSIVMTLLNAAESAYAVRSDGYRLSGVDIDVDIIPNVTFIMSKEGS